MKKFLIQSFLLINILFLFNFCSFRYHTGLKKNGNNYPDENIIFSKDFEKVLFKTSIEAYGKYFSGLMFIKQMKADSSFRVVFLSEVGLKIFDFEFALNHKFDKNGKFKIHYCLEYLNKKVLINALQKDIELILMNNIDDYKFKKYKGEEYIVYKGKYKGTKNYYFIENDNITKIKRSGYLFKKVEIDLNNYKNSFPEKISIKHKNIKLKIELTVISVSKKI
ncbi:MAG: hypothetical protein KAT68_07835 [Bacteroidales bacterium]|nr:hypothetical protein [Bacteroidales bacterium]